MHLNKYYSRIVSKERNTGIFISYRIRHLNSQTLQISQIFIDCKLGSFFYKLVLNFDRNRCPHISLLQRFTIACDQLARQIFSL